MNRQQLEHIIRAAAVVADDDGVIIIGSRSMLGLYPDAPEELRVSNEADVFPRTSQNAGNSSTARSANCRPFTTLMGTTRKEWKKPRRCCQPVGKTG